MLLLEDSAGEWDMIGERERANLVVATGRFFDLYIYIRPTAYVV